MSGSEHTTPALASGLLWFGFVLLVAVGVMTVVLPELDTEAPEEASSQDSSQIEPGREKTP